VDEEVLILIWIGSVASEFDLYLAIVLTPATLKILYLIKEKKLTGGVTNDFKPNDPLGADPIVLF
jgi:hypothetical protein